jgi:hypothetical protein
LNLRQIGKLINIQNGGHRKAGGAAERRSGGGIGTEKLINRKGNMADIMIRLL